MVQVIRRREAEEFALAQQLISSLVADSHFKDLRAAVADRNLREVLDDSREILRLVADHLDAEDRAAAALNLGVPRISPLSQRVAAATKRLELLIDARPASTAETKTPKQDVELKKQE